MRITDLLPQENVRLDVQTGDASVLLDEMVHLHAQAGNLQDEAAFAAAIQQRQLQGSTALERGVAVPHAKSNSVRKAGIVAVRLATPMEFGALDGQPSDLFFMIATPLSGDLHLEILSRLMVLLMEPALIGRLRTAKTPAEFCAILHQAELAKYGTPEPEKETPSQESASIQENPELLAVTACPTGIAHTYMAAEALEQAADQMGVSIKVETNGAAGVKNQLTAKEIAAAKGILVAADKQVEVNRFEGKPVLFVPVRRAIQKPQQLMEQLLSGQVEVYHAPPEAELERVYQEGTTLRLYKHLMTGISYMLPFVVGGGLLIALAFFLDDFTINPASFGSNTPLAAFFSTMGETAFTLMFPVLAGYIAMSIADRPALVAGFVGGSLAGNGTNFFTLDQASAPPISAGFLGAMLAGFLAGYLMLGIRWLFHKLPKSLQGIQTMLIYPVLGVLLIGVVMCLVNPVVSSINSGLISFLDQLGTRHKLLLGAVLGGMMSVDMGGPFNKAAYVTGTGAMATAAAAGLALTDYVVEYQMMAAVMVGGMVPPLAIALCTTFFPEKFDERQKRMGLLNYLLGLCFITEGAIPFAAQDPLRVISSCVLGSSVAGALSMLFGCATMAPHGGIFVFPVIHHLLAYLISLMVGSLVGMACLAALKKNLPAE